MKYTDIVNNLETGIQCDYCDWEDPDIIEADWKVGMPCPECGENLLTYSDYQRWKKVKKVMILINKFGYFLQWLGIKINTKKAKLYIQECIKK